jgi:hypothetical protein
MSYDPEPPLQIEQDKYYKLVRARHKYHKTIQAIRKEVVSRLNDAQDYIKQLAKDKSDDTFREALECDEITLPLILSSKSPRAAKIAQLRSAGKPIPASVYCEALYDVELDTDEQKQLGDNDGQLRVVAAMFRILGEEELSLEALHWVYND